MVCRILNPTSATDNSPLSLSGTTFSLRGSQPLSHRTIVDTYQAKGFYGRLTPWLRGKDSNLRPLGYEPNELPLLYPAMYMRDLFLLALSSQSVYLISPLD